MRKRVSFSGKVETRTIDEIDRQSEESRSDEESRQINKFQLLNLVDGGENFENKDGDNNETIRSDEDDDTSDTNSKEKSRLSSAKNPNSKSSKKSRKRRNKKAKGRKRNSNSISSEETEFDIELVKRSGRRRSVEEENIKRINHANQMYDEYNKHVRLLHVDIRSLLPENELKRMFGKSVVRDDRSRNQSGIHGGQRSRFANLRLVDMRQASSLLAGPKMEPDEFLNEMQFIKSQKQQQQQQQQNQSTNDVELTTVTANKGKASSKKNGKMNSKTNVSSIESLFNSNRPVYFKFVHDKQYQAAQREFVQAVHLAHPEAILHNLSIYPNHAESLLQLSHIIRLSEDYKQASEIIERTLITFERGFHTRFNLATAQCRLSYRRPENRTFFIVLFEQIISCHRRGLRKTPFEYSKLLLSLEPENDPLFIVQLVDFFALRSEEYDFLIEFYTSWWQVQKLPNMNFSLAMAYFLKSKCNKQSKEDRDKLLQLANEQLRKSLLLFPNFILPLLEACSGEPSAELKRCSYFDYSPYGQKYKLVPETLEVLIELYVKRSFGLWKQKQTLAWLERNVAELVNKFASGDLEENTRRTAEKWNHFKKPAPKNLLRHIALCDLKIKMPASASVSTFLAIDPFPPSDAIITYHSNLHQNSRTPQANVNTGSSLPGLFLRSFFPSFSLSDQHQQQPQQPANTTTQSESSAAGQADVHSLDHEIALGEYATLLNQLEQAVQPGGGEDDTNGIGNNNALQNSVRSIANSLSEMIGLTPLLREGRTNASNTSGSEQARTREGEGTGEVDGTRDDDENRRRDSNNDGNDDHN